MLAAGCANPGPPRPPSLQLPEMVRDLSAERIGDGVLLRWTTPSRTTDELDIKGSLVAEICRTDVSSASRANAGSKRGAVSCPTIIKTPTTPGAGSAWDKLPQTFLADPAGLLTYRIQILNAAGRSAGLSTTAAYAASGEAPAPVVSLTASPSEAGGVLRWQVQKNGDALLVDLRRTNLAPQNSQPTTASAGRSIAPATILGGRARKEKPKRLEDPTGPTEVHLRAQAQGPRSEVLAGTIDTTAAMGDTFSYVAETVRLVTVGVHALEIHSQPAAPATLAMRDTFPPKSPAGLATIPGATGPETGGATTPYIDLSWEPNSEPDLAGYLVYRQLARPNGDPQGPLGKMTPLPIAAPAYRDVAVTPGQRYIYSVTAVDASGNESAPSAKAQEVAAAQDVGSPP